ncbi:phosphatidylinositol N-acetylglucosaminyltransferase subunit C [Magnaporthiopsis poae ATCC 64411]|uniref:Phosphatidylinositol N-acetylglucosaminyltransferase subunit C n=1 Tax=Magnaporthiopsis poae (strain ATCC 64411 / 73-15) TaxID=644358 RepID=A0A0C4EE29_MAGP6|nr:phosphatidylinositol N-acetylglucosaminyltransferase subunit C [Magnaporthiopsis poae ATCC 64411]
MAPLSGLHQSSLPSDFEVPYQSTAARPNPSSYLTPAKPPGPERGLNAVSNNSSDAVARRSRQRDSRSRSRRRAKRTWKKLLWVKQSYPDNYTDQATFLDNLQRNPRLQPYEFWPLVADSTVIVQHVCSVIIFVVCFVSIFQERVSPVSVVSWGSFATFVGWCLCDRWVGQEAAEEDASRAAPASPEPPNPAGHAPLDRFSTTSSLLDKPGSLALAGGDTSRGAGAYVVSDTDVPSAASSTSNLLLRSVPAERPRLSAVASSGGEYGGSMPDGGSALSAGANPYSASAISLVSVTSQMSAISPSARNDLLAGPRHRPSSPLRGGRAHLRINAMKSALLIYFTLLGLSPILKSLTRSTSSDSIWAMSFWLLAINIFFFDYSGTWAGVNNISVASLSTNAALMASTVLASRLPSTGQVFGLTLFSLEVFGLFPVFRRFARHRSWRFHVLLTMLLVLGAGAGVGMTLARHDPDATWPWKSGLVGMLVGCVVSASAMGGCSWWLLGLQKYKNEIYGPWDPARPVIISRRHWDDE